MECHVCAKQHPPILARTLLLDMNIGTVPLVVWCMSITHYPLPIMSSPDLQKNQYLYLMHMVADGVLSSFQLAKFPAHQCMIMLLVFPM